MRRISLAVLLAVLPPLTAPADSVAGVMDNLVTELYVELDQTARAALDEAAILARLSPEEKQRLAEDYWSFDVNVPVTVSVMRHVEQPTVPFWLEASGFTRTDLQVKNEEYTYEVWRKEFPAGRVGLGINGFDWHRPVYFVSVAPQQAGDTLAITNLQPLEAVGTLTKGAMTYRDWTSLVITELPAELEGQTLLTTFRGRAREAHLLGAFRETPFPSGPAPDQIVLTWSEDPATTQTVQWRTNESVSSGRVQYRPADQETWQSVEATVERIHDRLLANDRYCNHFTATLRDLRPGTRYLYRVGTPEGENWSAESEFITGPDGPAPFIFGVGSDTHATELAGKTLQSAFQQTPEMAFFVIPGDVVSYGLYRDQWDHQIGYGRGVYERRPLMFTLGNHDDQDGLGAALPLSLFEFPKNGPASTVPEANYHFQYGNALFLMMDVGTQPETQAAWAAEVLSKSTATWKFTVHHFTMYNPVLYHEYETLRAALVPVFDQYHVDLVFQGHIHDYMRTAPLRDGQRAEGGTIYINAAAQTHQGRQREATEYIETYFQGVPTHLRIAIDGANLRYEARDQDGRVRDELTLTK